MCGATKKNADFAKDRASASQHPTGRRREQVTADLLASAEFGGAGPIALA